MSWSRARIVILILSLAVAAGLFLFGTAQYQRLVASRPFVVPAEPVPPYTLVTVEMLETRELAVTLVEEAVYVTVGEVVGRVTTTPLQPGQLIYRHQAVPPQSFRYVDDPALEIVSFPVDPAKAVGGQIRPGQRVNVYRTALGGGDATPPLPAEALVAHGAESELLAPGILVVDVRSSRGEAASRPTGSQWETQAREGSSIVPLTVLTVAVSPTVALDLVRLTGETRGRYDLWVTLAPLTPTPATGASPQPSLSIAHTQ